MSRKINIYIKFLFLAYISAFVFEEVPRLLFRKNHIWGYGVNGTVFIVLWYGVIFSFAYFVFKDKPIKYPVIFGIIFGMFAETVIFKQMNIFSFFLFPVLYGGMFYFPFKLNKKM